MSDKETCAFCVGEADSKWESMVNLQHYSCYNCGEYFISGGSKSPSMVLRDIHYNQEIQAKKHLISGYISEQGEPPTLTEERILDVLHSGMSPEKIGERIRKLLVRLEEKTDFLSMPIQVDRLQYSMGYAKNPEEYTRMIDALASDGYLSKDKDAVALTLKGIEQAQQWKESVSANKCFVAMWFNEEMMKVFSEAIKPASLEAGGYEAVIVSEAYFNDDITDRIVAEIRKCKFVIADLTGNRGGVYYEAGFAFGLGKTVIWTCNRDWFENTLEVKVSAKTLEGTIVEVLVPERRKVHFDIEHNNFILWSTAKELHDKLVDRISATIR